MTCPAGRRAIELSVGRYTVRDLPEEVRPRERLQRLGAGSLSDAELVAILLGSGTRGKTAIALAHDLLADLGGLEGLSRCGLEQLATYPGVGPAKGSKLRAAWELAVRLANLPARRRRRILSAGQAAEMLIPEMRNLEREHFREVILNTKHDVLACVEVAIGTLSASLVHPREVFHEAIRVRGAAIIVAHNHPSGSIEPSAEDLALTRRLVQAGELVGIPVLDHLIIGDGSYLSLKERSLM